MEKSLQARKQEVVQNAIFDAAIKLFCAKGFNETTVDEISAAAGVSQRSFFRYFPTKGDVLGYAIPSTGDVMIAVVRACPPEMAIIEVVREAALAVHEFSVAQPYTRQVIEITARNESARETHAAKMVELQTRLSEVYAERLNAPSRDHMLPRMLVRLTMMVEELAILSWYLDEAKDSHTAVDEVLAMLSGVIQ